MDPQAKSTSIRDACISTLASRTRHSSHKRERNSKVDSSVLSDTEGVGSCLYLTGGREEPLKVRKDLGTLESLNEKVLPSYAYPKEVPQGEGEANSQGHRAHAAIPPLVVCGKDAEHELERQEDLHCGGLAHTHPRVQLGKGKRREALIRKPQGFPGNTLPYSTKSLERKDNTTPFIVTVFFS